MTTCSLCHQEVGTEQFRRIPAHGHELVVHTSCFEDFAVLVAATTRVSGVQLGATGIDRLVKMMDGRPVLTHRTFPNEQMPFLAFLATQTDAVSVAEMYKWAEQNELRIANPALQVLRLKNKGFISVFDKDGDRHAIITEDGRKAIAEYAESLLAKTTD